MHIEISLKKYRTPIALLYLLHLKQIVKFPTKMNADYVKYKAAHASPNPKKQVAGGYNHLL
jgi:hypothetical protein